MSFSSLIELKDKLSTIALSKGLSSERHIVITYNNADTSYEPVRIIVSHAEPYTEETPLNILWLVKDSANPDYDKLLKRQSRSSGGTYNHTWSEVTELSKVFVAQVWDYPEPEHQALYDHKTTIGNPHRTEAKDIPGVVSTSDGVLDSPLHTRSLAEGEQYAQSEVVPKSWIDSALDQVRSVNEHIQQFFANINSQIDNLRTRVEALELSLLGLRGFIYQTAEAAQTWTITHNMNNSDIVVQVFEGGEVVWPASITVVDANNVSVEFAVPVAGQAQILPVVEMGA